MQATDFRLKTLTMKDQSNHTQEYIHKNATSMAWGMPGFPTTPITSAPTIVSSKNVPPHIPIWSYENPSTMTTAMLSTENCEHLYNPWYSSAKTLPGLPPTSPDYSTIHGHPYPQTSPTLRVFPTMLVPANALPAPAEPASSNILNRDRISIKNLMNPDIEHSLEQKVTSVTRREFHLPDVLGHVENGSSIPAFNSYRGSHHSSFQNSGPESMSGLTYASCASAVPMSSALGYEAHISSGVYVHPLHVNRWVPAETTHQFRQQTYIVPSLLSSTPPKLTGESNIPLGPNSRVHHPEELCAAVGSEDDSMPLQRMKSKENKKVWRKKMTPEERVRRKFLDAERKRRERREMTYEQREAVRRKDAFRKAEKRRKKMIEEALVSGNQIDKGGK